MYITVFKIYKGFYLITDRNSGSNNMNRQASVWSVYLVNSNEEMDRDTKGCKSTKTVFIYVLF